MENKIHPVTLGYIVCTMPLMADKALAQLKKQENWTETPEVLMEKAIARLRQVNF